MIIKETSQLIRTRRLRLTPNHVQRNFLVQWGIVTCIARNRIKHFVKTHPENQQAVTPWYLPNEAEVTAIIEKLYAEKEWVHKYPIHVIIAEMLSFSKDLKTARMSELNMRSIKNLKRSFIVPTNEMRITFYNGIKLLGYGQIPFIKRRRDWDVPTDPLSVKIRSTLDGKFWLELTYPIPRPTRKLNHYYAVGVDVGLKDLVTDSAGNKSGDIRLKEYEFIGRVYGLLRKLRALKERMRVVRRSKNLPWKKKLEGEILARIQKFKGVVARLRAKVANQKTFSLHAIVRGYVDTYDIIGVEQINYSGFTEARKKSIIKARWEHFFALLENRAKAKGKAIVYANSFFPSTHTCSETLIPFKHLLEVPCEIRVFTCPVCKELHDRDINAAYVLKALAVNTLLYQTKKKLDCLFGPIVALSPFKTKMPILYNHLEELNKVHIGLEDDIDLLDEARLAY